MRNLAPLGALLACLAPAVAQTVGGCPVFPANNIWNAPVDTLPLDAHSAAYIDSIGRTSHVHADFGSGLWDGAPIGIPYVVVNNQPAVSVSFDYDDESDPGPYPIPPNPPIEGGGDRHILIVDSGNCRLYELFAAEQQGNGSWTAGSGAIFDLRSNQLRPAGWTSADAAGLPILPGLARYDEIAAGEIRHALRVTAPRTRAAYIWPARHLASSLTGAQYPPMGQRFRLRASFDISHFSAANQVILRALKKYGMFLADNGSAWFISGVPDSRWDNGDLHALDVITGADFEAVDSSSLMADPNSAAVRAAGPTPAISAVLNAANSLPGLSPGIWMIISGTNLDGASVTVAGQAAAAGYVSSSLVIARAPDTGTAGQVDVAASNGQGTGTAAAAWQTYTPAFFLGAAGHVLAQHADFSVIGPEGAAPGEAIILFGAGFGAAASAAGLTVRIGGVAAELLSAAISVPGIWQLRVRVPAGLPSGDATVDADIAGYQTQQPNAALRIHRP
jgi:uncharacterized protein (TIGR03437 family)